MMKLILLFIIVFLASVINGINFYSQKKVNCSAGVYLTLAIDQSGNLQAHEFKQNFFGAVVRFN